MRREVLIGAVHLLYIIVRIVPVPTEMHRRKMQHKGRRIHERLTNLTLHDAHLNALGGSLRVQGDNHVHIGALCLVRHAICRNDQQVNVAFQRVEAPHDRRAVKVNADEVIAENPLRFPDEFVCQVPALSIPTRCFHSKHLMLSSIGRFAILPVLAPDVRCLNLIDQYQFLTVFIV